MNLDFIKDIGRQLLEIWREIKVYQRFTVILVFLLLTGMLSFFVVNAARTRYAPLYPAQRLLVSDAAQIKSYLDGSRVEYRVKGDTLIMVEEQEVHRIRMDLAAVGLPKTNAGKGFELFDSNTWIKGEKELQILEMRALKGELERDIAEYLNIKSASVILDVAPPRPFGGAMYKTKASVILTLMPGARLSSSQLRSMTYHVSGAVRGLQPNMIAISDTSGKLYQALDPEGEFDLLRSSEISVEERLKAKIDGMLAMVVGVDNFYSTVQVTMNRQRFTQERKVYSGVVNGVSLGEAVLQSATESGLQMAETERSEVGTPGTNIEAVAGAVQGGGAEILNRNETRNQGFRQMAVPVDHTKTVNRPGEIEVISIGVLIDKTITTNAGADLPESELVGEGKRNASLLKGEIENQLKKILEGYGLTAKPAVDFLEFDRTTFAKQEEDKSWGTVMEIATKAGSLLFVAVTVLGMFWTLNRFWKRHMLQPPSFEQEDEEEPEFEDEPSLMEVEAMVESIKARLDNDPLSVSETLHEWIAEENQMHIPPKK